jgi:hypothetical protein
MDQFLRFGRDSLKTKVIGEISRARTTFALVGNPLWVATIQPLSMSLIPPLVGGAGQGTKNLALGAKDWFFDKNIRARISELPAFKLKMNSGKIGTTGMGDVPDAHSVLAPTKRDLANEIMSIPANEMERHLSGIAAASTLRYAEQLGLSREAADLLAGHNIEATQSAYNKEARAVVQQNISFRGLLPFKTAIFEINSLLSSIAGRGGGLPIAPKGFKGKMQNLSSAISLVIGTLIGFEYVRLMTGRKMSIIQSAFPIAGDPLKAGIDFARGKLTGDTNFTQSQAPTSLQRDAEGRARAVGNAYRHGNYDALRRELFRWGMGYWDIGGASVVNRIIDAALAQTREFHSTGSGQIAFRIEGPAETARSFLTGVYSTKEGREYIEGGFKAKRQTRQELNKEVLGKLKSGEFGSVEVAEEYRQEQLKKIIAGEKRDRMKMPLQEYSQEVLRLIRSGEMTTEDAMKERKSYDSQGRSEPVYDSKFGLVSAYVQAFRTDPANAFLALSPSFISKEKLGIVQGNLVELERDYGIYYKDVGGSEAQKREMMAEAGIPWSQAHLYNREHVVPVSAGGRNNRGNLILVDRELHNFYTPIDIAVGNAVKDKRITRRQATKLMRDFKINKTITAEDVLAAIK